MGLIGQMFEGFRVGREEKIRHLERVPIFADCSLKQLRSIADISKVVEVPERTILFRSGEPGEEFFILIDGTAHVTVSPQKRARIRPGEFFGEMSLLDGGPRSATVIADTGIRLLVVHRRDFITVLGEVPSLTQRMLVTLCQRVRAAEKALNA